jgi:hypothetical protein
LHVLLLLVKHLHAENVVKSFLKSTLRSLRQQTPFKRKKGAVHQCGSRPEISIQELRAIAMAIIPVAIVAPAVAVFIPPATPLSPATLPLLAQFMPRMVRLSAVPSVILHSFVEPVVGFGNAPLALIVILGRCSRRPRKCQHAQKRRR